MGGNISPYFQDASSVSKGSLGECDGNTRAVVGRTCSGLSPCYAS